MSIIEQSLTEYLNAQAPITALVGDRIFSGITPQGKSLPLINFTVTGGGPIHSLDGASPGLEMRLYRFDIWVDKNDRATLLLISQAMVDALDRFRGTMGSVNATNVQRIMLMKVEDDFEPDSEAQRRMLEFDIDYSVV